METSSKSNAEHSTGALSDSECLEFYDACTSPDELFKRETISPNSFIYGGKPSWGWDYAFTFQAPDVEDNVNERPASPQTASTDHSSRDQLSAPSSPATLENLAKTEEDNEVRLSILARLRSAGFAFSQLHVPSEKIIMLRFSMTNEVMKEKAEAMSIEMPLKEKFGGGYLTFRRDRSDCFRNDDDASHPNRQGAYFCPSDRIIILLATLQSKEAWGCDLDMEQLVFKKKVLQSFALHSTPERKDLIQRSIWDRPWDPTWVPPFSDLKAYLGARVGLYFAFVSFYAHRLFGLAIFSIPVYITYEVLRTHLVLAAMRWIFAIILVMWTTWFLEYWKRRNAFINIEWGLNDYHEDIAENIRPQFDGEMRYGFYCPGGFVSLEDLANKASETDVEANMESSQGYVSLSDLPRNPYEDPRHARNALLQSIMVTCACVSVVGTLIFLILWYRTNIVEYFLRRYNNETIANAMPGILNALVISGSDPCWQWISAVLTRRENHRTNQQFENSLVLKRFSFQFISNYSSLFFIAFIKPLTGNPCRPSPIDNVPDCMTELEGQMTSLVITKATVQQLLEIGVPFISTRIKQFLARRRKQPDAEDAVTSTECEGKDGKQNPACSRYVQESKLSPYGSTLEDYAELVIQYGYLTLFGLAFPLAAVVNLINNLIEVRTDAFKILVVSQRTNADDAADIGAWYHILEFLGVLSVLTNAGLLVYTGDTITHLFGKDVGGPRREDVDRVYKVVAFFVLEHVLLSMRGSVAGLIRDIPRRTLRSLARQNYDMARYFNEGWKNAFRGTSQLEISQHHMKTSEKYLDRYDALSAAE